MIAIKDIKDRDSLREWLTDWPAENGLDEDAARAVAVTIAHRAAMRVLPVWWNWTLTDDARELDSTALPVLRCSLISGVAALVPTSEIKRATAVARASAAAYATSYATTAARASASATARASSAARATATARASATASATYASAAARASDSARAATAIWHSIQSDCKSIAEKQDVFATPLWSNLQNPFAELWNNVKSRITAPKMAFWIKWYEDALAGNPPNWDMLKQIALIDPAVWEGGVEAVAEKIAEIELAHALAITPNAEDIRINDAGQYQAYPRSTLPARTLEDANQRIGDVIRQIRGAQTNNQYTALAPEADLLEDAQARYGDNALRLFEVCGKVVRHIGRHLADGVLPENDNLVGDVSGDLQNTADDIYNFDEEAKTTINARVKLRYGKLSDEETERVITLVEVVAERSEVKLAQELREDAKVVKQEDNPTEETATERYRLGSRLLRIVILGGKKLLKDVKDATLLLGGLGGGIAVLWWIIRVLLGL